MNKAFNITILLLCVSGWLTAEEAADNRDALKNLPAEWTQQLLYEQTFVSPQAMCCGDNKNLYVYDHSRKTVYRMRKDWSAETFVKTGNTALRTIAWQPGAKRLIGFDAHAMYIIYPGTFRKLRTLEDTFMVSTVAVDPSDDSIYAAYEEPGHPLVHLTADGDLLKILRPGIMGCSQLAYNHDKGLLYFSETFDGSASVLNLRTDLTEKVIGNVAVAGTVEPIMLWLDEENSLWYYTANEGLFRSAGNEFGQIAAPMMGAGQVIWSSEMNNWVAIEYAGANLITYDRSLGERVDLTDYLNAFDIASDSAGRVFFPRYEFIYSLRDGRITDFAGPLTGVCENIETDNSGFVYAALSNGTIRRFGPDGAGVEWVKGFHNIAALSYDSGGDYIIIADRDGIQVRIYRIPVSSSKLAAEVAVFTEEEGQSLKRLAVGPAGMVFLYDWASNAVYLVDEKRKMLNKLYDDVLPTRDITTPGFEYSSVLDAFVIGTLEYYRTIDRQSGNRGILAVNRHGADNFAIDESPDGSLFFIHSGQIFRIYR